MLSQIAKHVNPIIALLTLALALPASAQTGSILFQVEGIDLQKGGALSAGVFNEANFPKIGKQERGMNVPVTAARMEFRLSHVPPGTYGAAVFQDVDNNKDLKTNFLGMPQEPIGFSNDARIRLGPPSYSDAQFQVNVNQETIVKIILR